jgi:hypothetical protein
LTRYSSGRPASYSVWFPQRFSQSYPWSHKPDEDRLEFGAQKHALNPWENRGKQAF